MTRLHIRSGDKWCRSNVILRCLQIKLLVVAALVSLFVPAAALEQKFDLNRYCADEYGPSVFATIDQRDGGPLCTERTDGGLGLLHRKVDGAALCQKLYQTRRSRMAGTNIICIIDAEDGKSEINLLEYCRDAFGPDAIVSKRVTDGAAMCSVPVASGLGLVHHLIDIDALCGGSGSVEDELLNCGSGFNSATGSQGSGPDGGASQRPRQSRNPPPFPPLTEEDIIDTGGDGELAGESLTSAHLLSCGNGDPETILTGFASIQKANRDPRGLGGWGWILMGVDLPCPGLNGGKIVSFAEICAPRGQDNGLVVQIRPDGTPICWPPDRGFTNVPESDLQSHFGLAGTNLVGACIGARFGLFGRAATPEESEQMQQTIPLIKYWTGDLTAECFYMDRKEWLAIISGEEDQFDEGDM